MWPVARPGRELQLIMIIGPSGVQFSLQSYEYFQWQNRTTAKQEPNLSITRMITDRTGRHEFLLPINHNHYKFRKKRHLGQKSSSNLKISQLWLWLILVSSDEATRSITTHVPPGQDVSPSHAGYSPTLLPPPPLWHFIRLSWLISATHLYSWVRGALWETIKCCTRTKHITWPGYKCRPHDPESTSLIIRPPYLHKRGEFMLNPCKKQILKNRRKRKILLSDF